MQNDYLRKDYLLYLKNVCNNDELDKSYIKQLNLEGLLSPSNYTVFKEFKINDNLRNIREINLAFCFLGDENLSSLIKENKFFFGLKQLKTLNFSHNKLSAKFMCTLVSLYNEIVRKGENEEICGNLKTIGLSSNDIAITTYENLEEFTTTFKATKNLILKNTPFESEIGAYLKEKIRRFYDEVKKVKNPRRETVKNEEIINKIIDGNGENLLTKKGMKIVINDIIKFKYSNRVKNLYPHISKNVELVPHFSD